MLKAPPSIRISDAALMPFADSLEEVRPLPLPPPDAIVKLPSVILIAVSAWMPSFAEVMEILPLSM